MSKDSCIPRARKPAAHCTACRSFIGQRVCPFQVILVQTSSGSLAGFRFSQEAGQVPEFVAMVAFLFVSSGGHVGNLVSLRHVLKLLFALLIKEHPCTTECFSL